MSDSKFKIDKNIPMPPIDRGGRRRKRCKYPLYEMEIGDSFFIEKKAATFGAYLRVVAQRHGYSMKFSARSVDGGCRIWRVS